MAHSVHTISERLSATLALDEPTVSVAQVSRGRAETLRRLSISTVRDLVTHFPRRYLDMSALLSVKRARIGDAGTIVGRIEDVNLKRPRRNLTIIEIALADETGVLMVAIFGQPWLAEQFRVGEVLAVAGTVDFRYGFKQMTNPYWEKLTDQSPSGRIIAVHRATQGLSATWMRRLIGNALDAIDGLYDPLPLTLRRRYRLFSRGRALRAIHFPDSMDDVAQARRRLVYEELFVLELHLMQQGIVRSMSQRPHCHTIDGASMRRWREGLPFELTGDQRKTARELLESMASPSIMNRLMLGDVGTGKTIVAAFGIVACADSGTQAMLLAPTEVLARQHHASLSGLLEAAGVSVGLLTGSTPEEERARLIRAFADGTLVCLIGTHALLEPSVVARDLSLAIIDEQQRFGVQQRQALLDKGAGVDALSLTATPIPRTLALAIYGDLSLSYLTERPFALHRTTRVLSRKDQGDAYEAALDALERGERVFVVCPLVGDADKGSKRARGETDDDEPTLSIAIEDDDDYGADVAGAVRKRKLLQSGVFRDYEVGLLHGGLSTAEKIEVMERFRSGEDQVLVATTIIEVGVDVPAATVMIIEDADRFGLSQLHQLRGRVGRNGDAAEVYLISSTTDAVALGRLQAMERTDDGFELATYDLSLRREGDILGNRQHGMSVLKLVNVVRDGEVIEAARADAEALLRDDPMLEKAHHRPLARELSLLFAEDSGQGIEESRSRRR